MIATQIIGIEDVIPTVNAIVDSGWKCEAWEDVLYNSFKAQEKLSKATNVIAYYQQGCDKTPWFFAFR